MLDTLAGLLDTLAGLALVATATHATAQEQSITPPPNAKLLLEAAAQGVQIYTCKQANDGYHWVFIAPDAALFDTAGRQIGTHFAGPSWQLDDGSKIVGEVVAQAPAPEPHAITWLLLRVKAHDGHGLLSGVDLVRRIDTQGGAAPATICDATQATTQARMRYTARYLFYAAPR
ncbi:MAG TPA: DUF3455 domain-containing protein [Acetobacteraceae bacterium]|nr:DUF3455 domain-containing protein [Acetobacteraceae bacterium]